MPAAAERPTKLGATPLPCGGETYVVLADPPGHPFCLCRDERAEGVGLAAIAFDCPDRHALAAFYAAMLGMTTSYDEDVFGMISAAGQPTLGFQTVEVHTGPCWPDPARPQQMHLDVELADADAAERAVLALGATRLPGEGPGFRVFADPVGHPFCLVW
ncbi:MAG: hypothetical protein HOV79_32935 [Hamadaea sp.]|nr:hypothetical protein [Hamadaea sp.]